MGALIVKIIGLIIVALGTIAIYDSRDIVKKYFSNSATNKTVSDVKIFGFVLSMLGTGILYFVL